MLYDHLSSTQPSSSPQTQDTDILLLRQAGRQGAKSMTVTPAARSACSALPHNAKDASRAIDSAYKHNVLHGADGRWLAENYRLLLTARKDIRKLAVTFRGYRTATVDSTCELEPLPYAVAKLYLAAA